MFYPSWIANSVLVPKPNETWRICTDFSDLNKACPKDYFPLLRIDQLVDATAGHELMSFMDPYSGYNQIKIYVTDQEYISFVSNMGLYCYKVMSFGLNNAGATYQQLVNEMFANQLGRNMVVYVDDMLVKSIKSRDHTSDLAECFKILKK